MKSEIKRDSAIDLFKAIMKSARDAGDLKALDAILDYESAGEFEEENRTPITNCEFNLVFSADYGGSEGIYLDCYLNGNLDESGHEKRLHFGTLKTLADDLYAMKIMGEACGILQFHARKYLGDNYARYEPDPAKLSPFHDTDTPFSCRACKNFGSIVVLEKPRPYPSGIHQEQYAFRCKTCGVESNYHDTSAALRKAWNGGEYWTKNSKALLLDRDALQSVCKLRGKDLCNLDCAKCPYKIIKELRQTV